MNDALVRKRAERRRERSGSSHDATDECEEARECGPKHRTDAGYSEDVAAGVAGTIPPTRRKSSSSIGQCSSGKWQA